MDSYWLLAVVVLTSLAACALGRHVFGLPFARLGAAVRRTLECAGAALLFWLANVALGAALSLLIRALGLGFVSIYLNTDMTLGVLSLLEALLFESWREGTIRTQR